MDITLRPTAGEEELRAVVAEVKDDEIKFSERKLKGVDDSKKLLKNIECIDTGGRNEIEMIIKESSEDKSSSTFKKRNEALQLLNLVNILIRTDVGSDGIELGNAIAALESLKGEQMISPYTQNKLWEAKLVRNILKAVLKSEVEGLGTQIKELEATNSNDYTKLITHAKLVGELDRLISHPDGLSQHLGDILDSLGKIDFVSRPSVLTRGIFLYDLYTEAQKDFPSLAEIKRIETALFGELDGRSQTGAIKEGCAFISVVKGLDDPSFFDRSGLYNFKNFFLQTHPRYSFLEITHYSGF